MKMVIKIIVNPSIIANLSKYPYISFGNIVSNRNFVKEN